MPISIRLAKLCADFGLTPYGVRYALEQYQKVIVELTDGKFSKLTYPAKLICDTARECFEKDHMEYWNEPPKEVDDDEVYVGGSGTGPDRDHVGGGTK